MKNITLLLLSAIAILQVNAQKLPNVQMVNLRAPANIKIDGKANDWGDKFQANNTTTELSYTIANDDKRLYIIAQADNGHVMNRIVNGGIKLIIQTNDKESDKDAPYVKFPFLQKGQQGTITLSNQQLMLAGGNTKEHIAPIAHSKAEEGKILDSLATINNKRKSKLIYTSGLAGIETALPIYNQNGIEAALAFDHKNVCTWEMAVDLKVFGLSLDRSQKFKYSIVINDEPNKYSIGSATLIIPKSADGTPLFSTIELSNRQADLNYLISLRSATTSFWGEYTLAK